MDIAKAWMTQPQQDASTDQSNVRARKHKQQAAGLSKSSSPSTGLPVRTLMLLRHFV
jgi:hypothetical protein